jgi:hypothetical protein
MPFWISPFVQLNQFDPHNRLPRPFSEPFRPYNGLTVCMRLPGIRSFNHPPNNHVNVHIPSHVVPSPMKPGRQSHL